MSSIDPFSHTDATVTLDYTPERVKQWFNASNKAFSGITLRKVLLKLHLYISLWLGAFLVLAGLTGSLLVYGHELDHWLNHDTMTVPVGEQPQPLLDLIAIANAASPIKQPAAHVLIPLQADDALIVRYQVPHPEHKGHNHHFHEVMVNPYTGQVLGDRDRYTAFMSIILQLHYKLLSGETGEIIMGITALLSLVLTVSGLYLWWPRWGKIKQAFTIKRNASATRFNFDLHKTVGIYTAVVLFVVSLSGVYFNLPSLFKPTVNWFSPIAETPRAVKSSANSGQPIAPEMALQVAQTVFPGMTVQRLFLPVGAAGSYMLTGRQVGETRSKGASMLWVDQYSGAVLNVRDPRQFNPGTAFINLQLPLHNGEILGTTGQILVLIAGFAPLALMITGLIHWLKKRAAKRKLHERVRAA